MDPRFFVSLNSSWRRRNGPFNGDRWEDTKVPWQRHGPKVDVLHMSRVFWRILRRRSESTTAALAMVDTLEFVTDGEMIAQYAASEEKRKQGREDKGKEIVPDVPRPTPA
jgi:hypothetical protein